MRHRLAKRKFCPYFRGNIFCFESIQDRQRLNRVTENYEICDQPKLYFMPELNVFVSAQEVCVGLKKSPEPLCGQIEFTLALAGTQKAKFRVRPTCARFWQKPYRFRSRFGSFIETAEIAIRKTLSQKN